MLNVKFQTETFNAAVRDGTAGAKLMKIVDAIKPEAIYFVEQGRTRGATVVVDMPDASKLPALVEPWLLTFQAEIDIHPVMTLDDLKSAGLDALGKKWA